MEERMTTKAGLNEHDIANSNYGGGNKQKKTKMEHSTASSTQD